MYIDHPNYFMHHNVPIQIELDKPHSNLSDQVMYRTSVDDIVKLKKKVKPKEEDELALFDW